MREVLSDLVLKKHTIFNLFITLVTVGGILSVMHSSGFLLFDLIMHKVFWFFVLLLSFPLLSCFSVFIEDHIHPWAALIDERFFWFIEKINQQP